MAGCMCAQGSQFAVFDELTSAVQNTYRDIESGYLKTLYASILRRLIFVMWKNGGMTDY